MRWLPMMMMMMMMFLAPQARCNRATPLDVAPTERSSTEVAASTRPHIYFCRSPSMEDFSCWWRPLDNVTAGEKVTYVLSYTKDKEPRQECPDYLSAGINSCYFDSSHTSIWVIYCMNVTAVTARGNYTSQQHCLDVADIVQTEAPVNLTHVLKYAGGDETGHNVLLSWRYPAPSDLQYGWITLEYELQYRRVSEPDNWKVKYPLKEPHLELLSLPVGDFVVRVRCRSHNYGQWSRWSSMLSIRVPTRPPAGKLLMGVLLSGVGAAALLLIVCGVAPRSKRIKHYFLPPVPKPRIIGIDPLLLKKGHLDEINHHFSSFHSYRPPSYSEEVWNRVDAADVYRTAPADFGLLAHHAGGEKDALIVSWDPAPEDAHHLLAPPEPASFIRSPSPYCSGPSAWPRPDVPFAADYSVMGRSGLPVSVAADDDRCQPGFYTCVQLMNESGEVHLVPFVAPDYCRDVPALLKDGSDSGRGEEEMKPAHYQVKTSDQNRLRDGAEAEGSETGDPRPPVAGENEG